MARDFASRAIFVFVGLFTFVFEGYGAAGDGKGGYYGAGRVGDGVSFNAIYK